MAQQQSSKRGGLQAGEGWTGKEHTAMQSKSTSDALLEGDKRRELKGSEWTTLTDRHC